MPIVLYSISEATDWLAKHGRTITEKGLRKAALRGDLRYIRMGSHYVLPQEDLEVFVGNPPRRGRPKIVDI